MMNDPFTAILAAALVFADEDEIDVIVSPFVASLLPSALNLVADPDCADWELCLVDRDVDGYGTEARFHVNLLNDAPVASEQQRFRQTLLDRAQGTGRAA